MSAVLSPEHISPVIADLERLQEIRKAFEELRDSEAETMRIRFFDEREDDFLCAVGDITPGVMHMALQALESAIVQRLANRAIFVEVS